MLTKEQFNVLTVLERYKDAIPQSQIAEKAEMTVDAVEDVFQ